MNVSIRRLATADLCKIGRLFHDTVHAVTTDDYTLEQLNAWSPDVPLPTSWTHFVHRDISYVAEYNGNLVGFGVLTHDGCIDMLYTHRDFQRQGIASLLLQRLEHEATALDVRRLWLESSVPARSFYRTRGYTCTGVISFERRGVVFDNFLMEKHLG